MKPSIVFLPPTPWIFYRGIMRALTLSGLILKDIFLQQSQFSSLHIIISSLWITEIHSRNSLLPICHVIWNTSNTTDKTKICPFFHITCIACTFKICQIFIKYIIIFNISCNCDITVTFVSTMRAFPPFTKKDF